MGIGGLFSAGLIAPSAPGGSGPAAHDVEFVPSWTYDRCERRGLDYKDLPQLTSGPWLAFRSRGGTVPVEGGELERFHLKFASIELEGDGAGAVLAFAKRYGPLCWRLFYEPGRRGQGELMRSMRWDFAGGRFAENYWDWAWHVAYVRAMMRLLDGEPLGWREGWLAASLDAALTGAPDDVRPYLGATLWQGQAWIESADDPTREMEARGHVLCFIRELCWPVVDFEAAIVRVAAQGVLGTVYASIAESLFQENAVSARHCRGCSAWFRPGRRDQFYHSGGCADAAKKLRKRAAGRKISGLEGPLNNDNDT